MQAVVWGEQIYFYEAGMRLNGCKTYQILEVENGYNTFEHLMQYALTGSMGQHCQFNARFNRWYATWNVVGKPGMVCEKIIGKEIIDSYPWVIWISQRYGPGEIIPESAKGTLLQLVSRIHVLGETKEELLAHIDTLQKQYHVKDAAGQDVLMVPHDVNDIRVRLDYEL